MAKQTPPKKFDSIMGNMMDQADSKPAKEATSEAPQAVNVFLDADVKRKLDRLVLKQKLDGKRSNKGQVVEEALRFFFTSNAEAARLLADA